MLITIRCRSTIVPALGGLLRDNDIIDNVTRTRTIQPLPDLNGGLVVVLLDGLRVVVAEDLGYWA